MHLEMNKKHMKLPLSKLVRSFLQSNAGSYQPAWQPAVDIYRCEKDWLIKVDLAGINIDDVQIEVSKNFLNLVGKRRDLQIQEGHQTYSMEISYNRFERTIELPINVEDVPINTEYKDGMLYIRIQSQDKE